MAIFNSFMFPDMMSRIGYYAIFACIGQLMDNSKNIYFYI